MNLEILEAIDNVRKFTSISNVLREEFEDNPDEPYALAMDLYITKAIEYYESLIPDGFVEEENHV